MKTTAMIVGLLTMTAAVGVWLVRKGWKGSRIDDHPVCPKCRFDLAGTPADLNCPECGSSADVPRLIGNRKRTPWRIAVGTMLLVLVGAAVSLGAMRMLAPGGYRALLPLWMARVEAKTNSLDAIDELTRRVASAQLSVTQVSTLADDAALCRHTDWVGSRAAWGALVDALLATGMLDAGRQRRLVEESVGVNWNGTSELFKDVRGDPVGTGLLFVFAPAVGSASWITFDADILSAEVEGQQLVVGPKQTAEYYHHVRNTAPGDTFINVTLPPRVAGKELRVRWRVRILDSRTGQPAAADWMHEEAIRIPASGDGFLWGSRSPGSPP